MKARNGQAILYLALVLAAIAVLMFMNVTAYLAVTAKNQAMNAGDAAAKAVAEYQGELLNEIGKLNCEHLELLMPRLIAKGDAEDEREKVKAQVEEIVQEQREIAFLGPLEGIQRGNAAAEKVGAKANAGMLNILRKHVDVVRTDYMNAPDVYIPPWEGAWKEYADKLEAQLNNGIIAGPDNIDFRNAFLPTLIGKKSFYNAVAGRSWCWFYFNARSVLESYSGYRDWPRPEPVEVRSGDINSEIYSLGVEERQGSIRTLLGDDELIEKLTGKSISHFNPESIPDGMEVLDMLDDPEQHWICFNTSDPWHSWTEIDPDRGFPVLGSIREEYDVRGCAAICRIYGESRDISNEVRFEKESDKRYIETEWSAAAKPFGTWDRGSGGAQVVTALNGFIFETDWQVRLVPIDAVGGTDLSTADPTWVEHLQEHLKIYYENGPDALSDGCWYCQQLKTWEREEVREQGREFLKTSSSTCIRSQGGGTEKGGTPHGR